MAPLCRGNVVTLLRTQSETSQRAFPRLLHPTESNRRQVHVGWQDPRTTAGCLIEPSGIGFIHKGGIFSGLSSLHM